MDTLLPVLAIAPARVERGFGILAELPKLLQRAGLPHHRVLAVTGERAHTATIAAWQALAAAGSEVHRGGAVTECTERMLQEGAAMVATHQPQILIGAGGGKALDAVKLLGDRQGLPVVTIPTTGATCAAWTALSNLYTDGGAFVGDVALTRCPDLVVVDYAAIATAPIRTLVAGIGDAIAKWYEASVSSGHSTRSTVVAAVQGARVLRDILLQRSAEALAQPGGEAWQEVVDATVGLAGTVGGLGGADCRTVAAHAIHNALTHLPQTKGTLHGEKVAFGILAQLRLEEFHGNRLAATARHQLLGFYAGIGLPQTLEDLGLGEISLRELQRVAALACRPESDIHRLPFAVDGAEVLAALVSTTAPLERTGDAAPTLGR
ncbi:MAG: iron-containing alcohol dehydrogenase family protein [Oscillatoriales cyanobacterium SM2_1_8]|nr:iron-containing alcohol dehydrogenase family protein [Oscillatoriales cyanobacterium SM2_1_8]